MACRTRSPGTLDAAPPHGRRRRQRPAPRRSCCSRPPAPAGTSSPASTRAATASAPSSPTPAQPGRGRLMAICARRQLHPRPLVVDRRPLDAGGAAALIGFGYVMMLAASPGGRRARIGTSSRDAFLAKQVVVPRPRRGADGHRLAALAARRPAPRPARLPRRASLLTAATLVIGVEIKGARRWLSLPAARPMQPCEFLKPCFAVVDRLADRRKASATAGCGRRKLGLARRCSAGHRCCAG